MTKFIRNTVLFLALLLLSGACLFAFDYFVIGNQNLGNYQASLLDKIERLQTVDGPKIVLIGNSNVCFGIDSEQIGEAFGMPVVNMGLHAGLGNAFHEDMVRFGVSEGDIVIVCHTEFDDTPLEPALAWITVEMHDELWQFIRTEDVLPMLRAYPAYFKDSLIKWAVGAPDNIPDDSTCYSRSAFNSCGDIVRRSADRFTFTEGSITVPGISEECIIRMNEMNSYLESIGAVMAVAGYPIGYGEYTPPAEEYDAFEQELREKLDCPVISHYTDYFIPYDLFFDAKYHLADEGVDIRTRQLITDIRQWLDTDR